LLAREPVKKYGNNMKRFLTGIAGIVILVGFFLIYNFSFWLFEGSPTIPHLEGTWWGGYYETERLGKQWCVARFSDNKSGKIQMALISSFGQPDIFDVERRSTDKNFAHISFTDHDKIQIEAKQLYLGKKYIFQRLLVGRFKDFWKGNNDIAIRGNFVSAPPPNEFGIEPLTDAALISFWKTYVRPEEPDVSPSTLLQQAGF
jgi:hypothetical protein